MEAAAVLLAKGSTTAEAAAGCGAGQRTIKVWLTLPHFRQRVSQLRGWMTEEALGLLIDNMASASQTLGFLSRRGKNQAVRLSAARAILELGARLREHVELAARVDALEAKDAQPQHAGRPA
jgi:hypothetical protein